MLTENDLTIKQTTNNNSLADNWFVVKTLPRHEKKVAEQLEKLNYTTYLPLQTTWRMWSDRKKKVELPLIPSIVFVKDLTVNKEPMYLLAGFHSILKLNGEIGRVKPHEIEQLRLLTGAGIEFEAIELSSFLPGDDVEIISGPFRGHYAKAIEDLSSYRVLIEISTLGIGYTINVAKNLVQKVTKLR